MGRPGGNPDALGTSRRPGFAWQAVRRGGPGLPFFQNPLSLRKQKEKV
jgi:hypothetical protein